MRERTVLDAATLAAMPKLRLIALTGATVRHVDLDTVRARGITLCWSGTYYPEETAEFTIGLMLAAERGIADGVAVIARGGFMAGTGLGRRMRGLRLGLLGFGNIGRRVSRIARAMDMDIVAWSPNLTEARAAEDGAHAASFDAVIATADILSLHLTLKPETRGLLGPRQLAAMKSGALLVNTSRGPLVDERALVAELGKGRIRAALDVFDVEPLPSDHPLRRLPGVTMTPHLGYATRECMGAFYRESIENILAWMDGTPIRVLEV